MKMKKRIVAVVLCAILKGKADYVLPIKENQLLTYTEIKEYFEDNKIYEEVKEQNYKKLYLKNIMELLQENIV